MRFLVVGTFMLVVTPALASHTPSQNTGITYYQPQMPISRIVVRHRHHHAERKVRHNRTHDSGTVHKVKPRHFGGGADGRGRARQEALSKPAPSQPPEPETHQDGPAGPGNAYLGSIKLPDGSVFADGMATPVPRIVARRPKLLLGTLTIAGKRFAYASGGAGWSIPYGTVKITPGDVGPWGKRHGAVGLAGDSIYDKQLGRDREGIEIHQARHMASAGCVVVEEFDVLKRAILGMIESAGQAFLHVGPSGAAITPTAESPLPPIIYLAEHIADEERHAEHHRVHPHQRVGHRLPHGHHYAHHHHARYARA